MSRKGSGKSYRQNIMRIYIFGLFALFPHVFAYNLFSKHFPDFFWYSTPTPRNNLVEEWKIIWVILTLFENFKCICSKIEYFQTFCKKQKHIFCKYLSIPVQIPLSFENWRHLHIKKFRYLTHAIQNPRSSNPKWSILSQYILIYAGKRLTF
jgi:hypothetical protein